MYLLVSIGVSPASDHYYLTSQSSENSPYFQPIENDKVQRFHFYMWAPRDKKGGGGSCLRDCSYGGHKLIGQIIYLRGGLIKFKIRQITKGLKYRDINILAA